LSFSYILGKYWVFTNPVFLEYFNKLEVLLHPRNFIITGYIRNINKNSSIRVSPGFIPLLISCSSPLSLLGYLLLS
jgi:hypothetical protein